MTDLPDAVGVASDIDSPPTPEADDDEVEPVELLVQLAEEGEIEPWDIDIVEVTDAFLSKLEATDLRTSARALFYASVLLRMKGDELLDPSEPEPDDEPEPWEQAFEEPAGDTAAPGFDPVDELEAEMDRRLDRKSTRGNPETLDELVRELREAERDNWWKRRREYDTSDTEGMARGTQTVDYRSTDELRAADEPTEGDVTGNTHNEDIEQVIEQVEAAIEPAFEEGRTELLYAEIKDAGGRAFMTYLALLFLSNRGSIRLQQDSLFGDLWVQDPAHHDAASEGEDDEIENDETEDETEDAVDAVAD